PSPAPSLAILAGLVLRARWTADWPNRPAEPARLSPLRPSWYPMRNPKITPITNFMGNAPSVDGSAEPIGIARDEKAPRPVGKLRGSFRGSSIGRAADC